jgi:hypothetical protein
MNGVTWASPTKYLNARTELWKFIKQTTEDLNIGAPVPMLAVDVNKKNN